MPNANKRHLRYLLRGLQACLSWYGSAPTCAGSTVIAPSQRPSGPCFVGFMLNSVYVVWPYIRLRYSQQSARDLEKSGKKIVSGWGWTSETWWAWGGAEGKGACKYLVKMKMCCSLAKKWELYPIILDAQNVHYLIRISERKENWLVQYLSLWFPS